MPTDTFFNLPQEKKNKIIEVSKKEFSRVPISEVSIKNIVEKAGIARGRFYQYFESKEELLYFLLEQYKENMKKEMHNILKQTDGDIFEIYNEIYKFIIKQIEKNKDKIGRASCRERV